MIDVDDKVLENINRSFIIPPRPEILAELKHIMDQPDPALTDISEVIAKDVALSGSILKLINSPAFGLARTVSDIKQAVMFLGFNGVYSLVQGLKLKQAFATGKCSISLERFWDSAEEIAEVALYIGSQIKAKVPGENLYTLGLFHDCGVPVLAMKFDDYVKVLGEANRNYEQTQCELEQLRYNTDHATIGYFIATSWHLPKDICQLILRHHDRDFLKNIDGSVEQLSFAALKMAENIVYTERRHVASPDWAHVKECVLDVLGFSEDDYNDLKEDVSDFVFG